MFIPRLRAIILLALGLVFLLPAQDTAKPAKPAASDELAGKTFQLKYVDPDEIRRLFSTRSFVMEADRSLGVLTVHGSPAFIKEVEDAVKQFDVPPPVPANLQLTIYLLTVAAQAPTGVALPKDLAAVEKELTATGAAALRLADTQSIRVREGQSGESAEGTDSPATSKLTRVKIQSASLLPGGKAGGISINGFNAWLNIFPIPPETARTTPSTTPDVAMNLDIEQDKPVIVSRAGADKPIVIVLKAALAKN